MSRRPLPPVADAKRTLRRTTLLAAGAAALALTVGAQSAAGVTTATRGRARSALQAVVGAIPAPSPSDDTDRDAEVENGSVTRSSEHPTTREQLLDCGHVPRTYVSEVLFEHGGRVKQCRFVEEYGWSASTISRLLTELEEDGEIERYRIGREKVVSLPETRRPVAAESAAPATGDAE
ncbi:helix-turn-helix transcriptional regulator [Natrononativus amylolyticus]|uniref:helix-turn-helix transcriptional regulator n=1 Tax=Natrononativus amylolyticus TaxID=2963434 RepID=UPI0020CC0C08|nr:MarR family transcriptional regulator [Natrononativus amylolyticus]